MPETEHPGSWSYAAAFVVTPSLLATVAVWHFTHDIPMTYVTWMTVWLFAVVGAAFVGGPGR